MPRSKGTSDASNKRWTTMNSRFQEAKSAKAPFEADWTKANRFRKGEQWETSTADDYREHPVTNYIAPIIETRVAALVEEMPNVVVESRLKEHEELAQTMTKLVQYVFDINDMTQKLDNLEDSRVETGTFIAQVFWDPTMFNIGDIRIEHLDVANFFTDPAAYTLDKCEWVIHAFPVSTRYVKERYDKTVEPDKNLSTEDDKNQPGDAGIGDRVMLLQMFERTKGGWNLTTGANEVILREEESFCKRLPYVVCRYETLRKCFWGMGLPKRIITIQERVNKWDAIIMDNAKVNGNIQKIVNVDRLVDKASYEDFTNEPGKVHFKQGDGPLIELAPTGNVPGFLREQRVNDIQSLEQLGGYTEVQRGESPSGRPSGSLVDTLMVAGDRVNRRLVRSQHAAFKEIAEIIVGLAMKHYDYQKTFKVTDKATDQPSYFDFSSKDLANANPEMDVRILPGTGLPNSGAYRAQRADRAWETKGIDRITYLKETGYSNAEEIDARIKADQDEEDMKALRRQTIQNQMAQGAKAQSQQGMQQGGAPQGEPQGGEQPQGNGVDDVTTKLSALSPDELAKLMSLPPDQQIQEIMNLADSPITPEQAQAILDSIQGQ